MKLNICHLYPDVLNLYGDGGNIICMRRRLGWRGIETSVRSVPIGETVKLSDYDLAFIGGGQDFEQEVLLEDLRRGKDAEIRAAVEDGLPLLAICGGYQLLGRYYQTHDGRRYDFTGILDLVTVGGQKRLIGNYMFRFQEGGTDTAVVGFENHSGRTYLGSGVAPLGTVLSGFGNNGEDGTEGVRYKNVFGSYGHGSLLPKNPAFCDYILQKALERKYGSCALQPLEDASERLAHDEMVARLSK